MTAPADTARHVRPATPADLPAADLRRPDGAGPAACALVRRTVPTGVRRVAGDGPDLAVGIVPGEAPGEPGRGLGRALVLESFRRFIATGAMSLGLGVIAANRGALGLYVSIGLETDREWQLWDAPATV